MKRINVTRSSMPAFEEYIEEIRPLWESRWLSNAGVIHKTFEKQLCEYLGVERVALFANGHVALEVSIDAFHFPKGSEFITTPYTHCSTIHSIVRNGCVPVYCDVREDNFTIDPDQIEDHITENTVAIMATHVYGEICDVKRIGEIAEKHGLKVFYDAAHAFGEKLDGTGIGTFGDFSMFSTHATKVFHTIEGGITVMKDDFVASQLESLTNFGFDGPEEVRFISTNARMNEFEAAMGICNLRHIDEEIQKRKKADERYRERLSGVKGIRFIETDPSIDRNYAYMPVFFDGFHHGRNEIQRMLAEKDIFARKYFYPITSELFCYKDQYADTVTGTPVSKWASEHVLALPMFADLTVEDVDLICDVILS